MLAVRTGIDLQKSKFFVSSGAEKVSNIFDCCFPRSPEISIGSRSVPMWDEKENVMKLYVLCIFSLENTFNFHPPPLFSYLKCQPFFKKFYVLTSYFFSLSLSLFPWAALRWGHWTGNRTGQTDGSPGLGREVTAAARGARGGGVADWLQPLTHHQRRGPEAAATADRKQLLSRWRWSVRTGAASRADWSTAFWVSCADWSTEFWVSTADWSIGLPWVFTCLYCVWPQLLHGLFA